MVTVELLILTLRSSSCLIISVSSKKASVSTGCRAALWRLPSLDTSSGDLAYSVATGVWICVTCSSSHSGGRIGKAGCLDGNGNTPSTSSDSTDIGGQTRGGTRADAVKHGIDADFFMEPGVDVIAIVIVIDVLRASHVVSYGFLAESRILGVLSWVSKDGRLKLKNNLITTS